MPHADSAELTLALATAGPVTLVATGCEAGPSQTAFRFDVDNRSEVAIVVSVVSDTNGLMQGFIPGEQGTITIPLGSPNNGIGVEILRALDCTYLVEGTQTFPTPVPFTLIVDGGPDPGSGVLTVEREVAPDMLPRPQNGFRCPGG